MVQRSRSRSEAEETAAEAAGTEQGARPAEERRSPVHDVISSGGSPLDTDTRTDMESRMGADFSDVRVHHDTAAHESAKGVGAHAYTVGNNVVFQRDAYDPSSPQSRRRSPRPRCPGGRRPGGRGTCRPGLRPGPTRGRTAAGGPVTGPAGPHPPVRRSSAPTAVRRTPRTASCADGAPCCWTPGPRPGPPAVVAAAPAPPPPADPCGGARPRRGWRRPRLGLPIVLVLLAVGVWFVLPHLSGLFGFARQETGTPESMPPAVCRASSEADGHPASAAVDGFNNRYWAPERAGEGVGEHLECDFAQPVRMMKIVVFSGTSARQDEFLTQSRPARLTVELTSEDGEKTGRTIRLRDQAGQQTFDVRGSGTVSARITVASAYGTGKERRTALAEVEFFGRRE